MNRTWTNTCTKSDAALEATGCRNRHSGRCRKAWERWSRRPNPSPALVGAAMLIFALVAIVSIEACESKPKLGPRFESSSIVGPGAYGYDLFQAHCAACHGTNGQGDGPTAIALDVTPRDFCSESFRYVSSMDGVPTSEDLLQSIRWGRINGHMPAGPWLNDDEVTALADYVRELNRLGWLDRLEEEFADEAGTSPGELDEISHERVTAEEAITVVMTAAAHRPNLDLGRQLYFDSCASCHGTTGTGDGLDTPLDELGRSIKVRDLTNEPIQGGDSLTELFKRIRCGVPGTPMPSQAGLTDDQVWQLVHYTRYLMGKPVAHAETTESRGPES